MEFSRPTPKPSKFLERHDEFRSCTHFKADLQQKLPLAMVVWAKSVACFSAFAAGKAEVFVEPVVGAEDGFSLAKG